MIIKIDGKDTDRIRDFSALVKFLKENTHGGKVDADLEVFKSVQFPKQVQGDKSAGDSFHWVMSTFDIDRDEEKIDQSGWQLENYLKNPVVLWSHDYKMPAIGYAKNVCVKDGVLCGDIVFNEKEVDEFGYSIGQRVKVGAIRAGSVGFRVDEVEFLDGKSDATVVEGELDNNFLLRKRREATYCSLIFRKQELLEFSICNVPCNPFALTGGKATSETKRTEFFQRLRDSFASFQ